MSLKLIDQLLEYFFHHQIVLKMYHFQTKSYGAHKASDAYLATLLANFDKFFEVAQGIYGKVDMNEINVRIQCANDDNIVQHLEKFISTLKGLDGKIKDTSLINLRDEMVADAQQLKYLLTFK